MNAIANPPSDLSVIERQLAKLDDTATNLQIGASQATRQGKVQEAAVLAYKADDLRTQQFLLYRKKSAISVTTTEWTSMVKGIEDVNASLEVSLKSLDKLADTVKKATKLVDLATKLVALLG